MNYARYFCFFVLLSTSFSYSNNKVKKVPQYIKTVEGIEVYQFNNGLKLLLFQDASQDTVTVNLTYLVGSRHEGRGEAGMAHLLEHMLFKGSTLYPNPKGILQDKGAFYNATTWTDRTNYFETLPASKENLEFALAFEADRMQHSFIKEEDLKAEMTVVRNEFEIGENDPFGVLHDKMMLTAYEFHNYGKPTIGNRSDIERVPAKALRAFYKNYYQPDNAVLIVAGKFEKKHALEQVNKHFGSIPKPARVLDKTYTQEPVQDGPRFVKLQRAGDVGVCGLGYHIPAGSHEDYESIQVLTHILTNEPTGLLYQTLVETKQASEVFGFSFAFYEPGMVFVFAKPTFIKDANQVLEQLKTLTEDKIQEAITEESVNRAKAALQKSFKLAMNNSKDLALKLSESIAQGGFELFFIHRDRVSQVTVDRVKEVARQYLIESNRTAGLFEPTAQPVRAAVPEVHHLEKTLSAYQGTQVASEGEVFEATVENIEKRVERRSLTPHIQTAFLYKKTRQDAVKVRLTFRFGNEQSLTPYDTEFELLPQLLVRGTQHKTQAQIQDALNLLESSLRLSGQAGILVADIQSDEKRLPGVMDLLEEMLKMPALSEKEWEIVKNREMAELEESLSDPERVGFNALDRAKNPYPSNSLFYVPTLNEKREHIAQVTLKSLQKAYAFYGAGRLQVGAVGTFDQPQLEEQLKKAFSTWNIQSDYKPLVREYLAIKPGVSTVAIPDKQMTLVAMATNLELKDTHPDYAPLRLANYLFGEGMKARLLNRVREREGISYSAGSYIEVNAQDFMAHFSMFAMAANDKAQAVAKAMKEEYEKWLEEGALEDELKEGQIGLRLRFSNLLSNDGFLLNTLTQGLENDRDMWFYERFMKSMEGLGVKDIQKVLQNYLKKSGLFEVTAGSVN